MYKKILTPDGVVADDVIVRLADGAYVFFHESNPDYQAYLKWLSEGNTPEPADQA